MCRTLVSADWQQLILSHIHRIIRDYVRSGIVVYPVVAGREYLSHVLVPANLPLIGRPTALPPLAMSCRPKILPGNV